MPGWYAEGVEDGIHGGDDMKVSARALHRLKAQAEGLLLPEDVRRIRRKLGLSQREAGRVIGGGPNAFQKYEAGDIMVSHAISSALRVLDFHPGCARHPGRASVGAISGLSLRGRTPGGTFPNIMLILPPRRAPRGRLI